MKKGEFVRSRPYGYEHCTGEMRWMFFFTNVNIEGTDDGMAGDGAGVWGCGGG